MKITTREWIIFIVIAIVCFNLWLVFGYPQFTFIDLSIDRKEALRRAESYLLNRNINPAEFLKAVVFSTDNWSDRYLQKTLKLRGEEAFIREHKYELFCWQVRFFKEFSKEEFAVEVSPRSGEIVGFSHLIEDIEPRPQLEKEIAKQKVEDFLKQTYGLNLKEYDFHEENIKRYERRIDYGFSWEKKGVYIPWQKDQGGAKLLIGATISGEEIRGFYKSRLDIPEKFQRYIANKLALGEHISGFAFILLIAFVIYSIFLVLNRRYALAIRFAKRWFISLAIFLAILNVVYLLNNFQGIIFGYPTSISLASFIGLQLQRAIINLVFLSIFFIMPGLAGEWLREEVMPDNRQSSFFHYLKSTFYSRNVTKSILLGHLLFFIILGFQAVIFYLGQKYAGVWKEWMRLAQFSSAYIPFLSAFIIGVNATFSEEIIFRIFGISLAKKYLKNAALAVAIISLCWGLGHSGYAIFPVWFRILEISLIGLLFGFIFFRYGIIPLIVAHYLFDVFWGLAAYILGRSCPYLFFGSLVIMTLPLAWAVMAYWKNKEEKERQVKLLLDATQRYNLDMLIMFVSSKKSQGQSVQAIKEELILHHWDGSLVELAIEEVFKLR